MIINKIRYILFFALTLILYTGFRGRTLFLIMAVLVVLPFISMFVTKKIFKRMSVDIEFLKDNVGRGAINEMSVIVKNPCHLPNCGVTLTFDLKNSLIEDSKQVKVDVPVEKYGDNTITLKISADHCGYVYIDNVDIKMCDMLQLISFNKNVNVEARYMVIPSYVDAPSNKSAYKPQDDSEINVREVGEDTTEIESMREYRPGDRMQRIHWKLSSKMEELMVKEYAVDVDIDISLVCEIVIDNVSEIDTLMDALYSLMVELSDNNERYAYYYVDRTYNDVTGISIASREDVIDAIAQLYYIKPYEQKNLATTLVKAKGITPIMVLKKATGKENLDEILYEFEDKVVLVWE